MRKLILPLLMAAAIPAPAMAEGNFSGPYLGVSLGYTFLQKRNEAVTFDRGSNGSFGETVTTAAGANAFSPGFCSGAAATAQNADCRKDSNGGSYHARAGYDFEFSGIVLGIVGEIGKSNLRDSVAAFSTTPAFYTMTRKVDFDAALRLRAGVDIGQRTLVYATGGGAYAKLNHDFVSSNTVNAFTLFGDEDVGGWQAGAGVEHRIGKNFSIGAEYLYSRYQDRTVVRVSPGSATATNPFVLAGGVDFKRATDRFDHHGVRVTASYRF